jgi:hypothetical protein
LPAANRREANECEMMRTTSIGSMPSSAIAEAAKLRGINI